jgi:hypothetical protein
MPKLVTIVEVASSSSPGTWYRVWVDESGPIFCECPAHKFHKGKPAGQRPDCKHMKALRATSDGVTAQELARYGELAASAPKQQDSNIRFLELIEADEDNYTEWVSVVDLARFNNLEV